MNSCAHTNQREHCSLLATIKQVYNDAFSSQGWGRLFTKLRRLYGTLPNHIIIIFKCDLNITIFSNVFKGILKFETNSRFSRLLATEFPKLGKSSKGIKPLQKKQLQLLITGGVLRSTLLLLYRSLSGCAATVHRRASLMVSLDVNHRDHCALVNSTYLRVPPS